MFISTLMFLNIDSKVKIKTESKVFSNLNISNEVKPKIDDEYFFIEIKGQVAKPGVYSLEKGKRVVDAINVAGGLTENADTALLNQSIKLTDQMVIIVYSKEEIENLERLKEQNVIDEEICQKEIKNEACICNNRETVIVPDIENKNNIETSIVEDETKKNNNINNKININTAPLDILMTLPKIGKVKAEAIMDYRNKNKFNDITDIKNVKGIGDSLFEAIKDYITI